MKCRKAESGLFLCLQVRTEGSIAAGNSWNVQARFWKSNPREMIDSLKLELMEHYLKPMQKNCGMSPYVLFVTV